MRRSVDWTLIDNVVNDFFCATLTGCRGSHTPSVQAGAETSDIGAEADKPDHAVLGRWLERCLHLVRAFNLFLLMVHSTIKDTGGGTLMYQTKNTKWKQHNVKIIAVSFLQILWILGAVDGSAQHMSSSTWSCTPWISQSIRMRRMTYTIT